MRKTIFANNEIYHIYNRGVEKRKIFLDDKDYFRFIHDLFEFNDEAPAENIYYKTHNLKSYEVKPRKKPRKIRRPRKLIVEILAFCLMPNHFHLFVRQLKDGGIPKFMHKLGTGYTMSFNQKYERVGSLFQGSYKAILIDQEPYFYHLLHYIHLNPLDLKFPGWREGELKDYKEAIKFLENYRWSSHLDYISRKNFPSITNRKLLLKVLGGTKEYKRNIRYWLKDLELEIMKDIILE